MKCPLFTRKKGRKILSLPINSNENRKTMRKIYSIFILLTLSLSLSAQNNIPTAFDECVDLMSLIWRLAGAREYKTCPITPYAQEADTYFADFKEHNTVKLARKYIQEKGVAYDAVASMGIHLDITSDGKVVMDPKLQNTIEKRWTEEMQKEFLVAVNDFYTQTNFHKWYTSTLPVQEACLKAFQTQSSKIDLSWFGKFFQESDANFRIILCPLAGNNNYGMDCFLKDGSQQLCPVISSTTYKDGQISYENSAFPIIIHEFCHAYCNPLIDKFWEQMAETAENIYKERQELLSAQAYTRAKIMMYESLVRASVIQYMQEHYTPQQVNFEELIADEESKGFLLTRTLLNAFAKDKGNLKMEAFMPTLLQEINSFTLEKYKAQQIEADKNKIHYKVNIENGSTQVAPGDFTLTITFDEPLYEPGISMNMVDVDFPQFKGYSWSEDKKILSVNFFMEPDHEYGFQINGSSYRNKEGKVAVESVFKFKTKK